METKPIQKRQNHYLFEAPYMHPAVIDCNVPVCNTLIGATRLLFLHIQAVHVVLHQAWNPKLKAFQHIPTFKKDQKINHVNMSNKSRRFQNINL